MQVILMINEKPRGIFYTYNNIHIYVYIYNEINNVRNK